MRYSVDAYCDLIAIVGDRRSYSWRRERIFCYTSVFITLIWDNKRFSCFEWLTLKLSIPSPSWNVKKLCMSYIGNMIRVNTLITFRETRHLTILSKNFYEHN